MSLIFNCESLEKRGPWNENLCFDFPVSKNFTDHFQSSVPARVPAPIKKWYSMESSSDQQGQSKVAFEVIDLSSG